MREHESFSSFNTYLRCPKQYEFRYCQGIKTPPAVAIIEGSAGHKASEFNYKQKVESRQDLPLADILDVFSAEYDTRVPEIEDWEDSSFAVSKDSMIKVMKCAHADLFPTVQPVEVEKKFEVEVMPGRVLLAYRDVKDESGVIRDSKFTKRAKSQADADNDLQLSIYSYLDKSPRVAFDCLVKTKIPKAVSIFSTRGPQHWARLEHMIPAVLDAIDKQAFPPCDPSSWACSEKFCGYWRICQYGGKNTNPLIIDMGEIL
jgi:putative RecB family exonuclease